MIVVFNSPLVVKEITDELWELAAVFQILVTDGEARHSITVPTGYRTNFASVPRIPIIYEYAGGYAHRASVAHDYLYHQGGSIADRLYADNIFLAAMLADNIDRERANAMYSAVRLFGANSFAFSDVAALAAPQIPLVFPG